SIGLGRLALGGVAAARVPPEATAEGIVPEAALAQEVSLALRGMDVALPRHWIVRQLGGRQQRKTAKRVVVSVPCAAIHFRANGVRARKVAAAGVVPQPVEEAEALVHVAARVERTPVRRDQR